MPDESTWYAACPTVMALVAWRRGHVAGNIMPPVGALPGEQFLRNKNDDDAQNQKNPNKNDDGDAHPQARTTRLWTWALQTVVQSTRQMTRFRDDGVLRTETLIDVLERVLAHTMRRLGCEETGWACACLSEVPAGAAVVSLAGGPSPPRACSRQCASCWR